MSVGPHTVTLSKTLGVVVRSEHMPFIYDDGGRKAAGYVGSAGDCVTRAVAIATQLPYQEVYDALSRGSKTERVTRAGRRGKVSARDGVHTGRKWFKDFMASIGWTWTPTMQIGQGCRVHLVKGELPAGRLVVAVSKHYTAVIDGIVCDTHDPQRTTFWYEGTNEDGSCRVDRVSERCVYGYWHRKG